MGTGKRAALGLTLAVFLASWVAPLWPVEQALHSSLTVVGLIWLWRHDRRCDLMLQPGVLRCDERRSGHEDLLTMLHRAYLACAERTAIAQALHAILDRRVWIAQAQKIQMQRMRVCARGAAPSCN